MCINKYNSKNKIINNIYVYIYILGQYLKRLIFLCWTNFLASWPRCEPGKNNSPMRGSRWVSGLISWFSKEFGGFEHFQLELVVWNMTLFSPILPLWFSPWAPSSACETWNQRMAQNYTCTDTKLSETASTSDATYGYSSVFFSTWPNDWSFETFEAGWTSECFWNEWQWHIGCNASEINRFLPLVSMQRLDLPQVHWISFPYANHGAGICTPTFTLTKSPSFVGKYTIHGAYGIVGFV